MPVIRRAEAGDLQAVAAIQAACPEAAGWAVADYLQHDFRVAVVEGAVAGFAVSRMVAGDECELLNLAVAPEWRRQGLAGKLLQPLLDLSDGQVFLEVRESNEAARNFYKSMGFQEVSIRNGYYDAPPEAAIVMKFHSC